MKKTNFIRGTTLTLLLSLYSVVFGNTCFIPREAGIEYIQPTAAANPSLTFNNVWAEHNVYSNGQKGMFIHLDVNINGLRDRSCYAVAYFYHENGYPLHNRGGSYRTTEGKVATSKGFSPDYDRCHTKLTLFIPYGELHLNGTFPLKYFVSIFSNGAQIGNNSKWETFRLTWRMDVPESECPKCGC